MLPAESLPSHTTKRSSNSRVNQAAFSESPSASSNASSPGVIDMLQTPSDTSPLAHRLPHMPDFLPGQLRNRSNTIKTGAPFAFDGHTSVQGSLHGLPGPGGQPHEQSTIKTYSSVPRFSTSVYDLSSHSSITPSNGVFPNSYPLNDSAPSSSIYATSQASATPYQGIFNPFDNAGIASTRFLDDSRTHEDFSKLSRRQGGGLSDNLIWPQSITPSLDYNYHVPLCTPMSQRRQSDSIHGTLNNPGFTSAQVENKTIPPFPTQSTFDAPIQLQQRQASPHASSRGSGTNAPDSDFVTRDILRNLAISGLNRHREKQRPAE